MTPLMVNLWRITCGHCQPVPPLPELISERSPANQEPPCIAIFNPAPLTLEKRLQGRQRMLIMDELSTYRGEPVFGLADFLDHPPGAQTSLQLDLLISTPPEA